MREYINYPLVSLTEAIATKARDIAWLKRAVAEQEDERSALGMTITGGDLVVGELQRVEAEHARLLDELCRDCPQCSFDGEDGVGIRAEWRGM